MSLIVNNNIAALNTQRNLNLSSMNLNKSLEKLSSGFKINTAADDPSGLIISEQLRSQTSGLERAIRNSQEASNVIGIAEGALIEMNSILRKLRALALHAANSGITAPDQVRADQAEVDSSIQTLDRIANTTRYSDQFLLNGSKSIVFDRTTLQDEGVDHQLLNVRQTRIDQVFKRTGSAINIQFAGVLTADQADATQQAKRAYFEADSNNSQTDIDTTNGTSITQDQAFILTGTKGSRQFAFSTGTTLGSIASAISNVSGSTGVEAQLIFGSDVTPTATANNLPNAAARAAGMIQVYNAGLSTGGTPKIGFNALTPHPAAPGVAANRFIVGKTTDGHGRIFAKVVNTGGTNTLEFYKDRDESVLLGTGDGAATFTSLVPDLQNNDIRIALSGAEQVGDVFEIALVGIEQQANDGTDFSGLSLTNVAAGSSVLSGVDLGRNTDQNGTLYIRATGAAASKTIEVFKGSDFNDDDLVAQATGVDLSGGTGAAYLESVVMPDGTDSDLNMILDFDGAISAGVETGRISFDNLGIRISSSDYGSQAFAQVQNLEGQLFAQYKDDVATTPTMVEVGQTVQQGGQDATLTLNGSPLSTDGLVANVTTPDFSGAFTFNEGKLGETTIGASGYTTGGLFSRATSIQSVTETVAGETITTRYTYATNARKNTDETLDNFIGGMQFQLGEGEGDQERTVYGVSSMAAANIGLIEDGNTTYTLQDVLAGGRASLMNDPVRALRVVTQAVNDVSELRARLGAFQKNTLQTNINSLNVAVEKITLTESAIRDANMAAESTEFTKNQILVQAGTAMLAQANTINQNVLQLLG